MNFKSFFLLLVLVQVSFSQQLCDDINEVGQICVDHTQIWFCEKDDDVLGSTPVHVGNCSTGYVCDTECSPGVCRDEKNEGPCPTSAPTTVTPTSTTTISNCPSCNYIEDDDSNNCRGYIECSTGYPGSCAQNACFNPTTCKCETSTITPPSSCPCGYVADSDASNCRGYTTCSTGLPGACGIGYCFNPTTCRCVISDSPYANPLVMSSSCPSCGFKEDEDASNCRGFIQCSTGNAGACPANSCFDPASCSCKNTASFSEDSCSACGYKKDLDLDTCTGFINCATGYQQHCSSNECFDEESCSCRDVSLV